jgi:hypothetical protein
MFTWDYRIIKEGDSFSFAEVQYNENGKIKGWSLANPNHFLTLGELEKNLDLMKLAFEKPVIEFKEY